MKVVLALVALTAPAFAQAPGETQPAPAPDPSGPPPPPPGPEVDAAYGERPPEPEVDPAYGERPAEPEVDPAYGERPDRTPSGERVGPDDSYVNGVRRGRPIVVRFHAERSRKNVTALAVTAGSGLVSGALGLFFHYDSRSASEDVEADGFSGRTWSAEHQDLYDRAHRSAAIAGVFYGIGGVLLLATAIAYIVTEPGLETRTIHPHTQVKSAAVVAPTQGGAFVGQAWRF